MTYDTIGDAVTMQGGAEGTLLAGRYRVVRQLGQGGMGSVWLAEDTQLDNKQFAIKMLPSVLVSNKRAYRQLKDEALVAMKLVHPNIVQLRAFEENNGNPFLVMDYIDGETLDDYLAEKGKLAEDDVLRVLRPIAAALDYAHSKGVVHRDVKPGNVMIAKDGTPYILDFGIAREIQETMTRVTGKLSSGTLLYMSPEQLRGQQPRPAQDVYSFAAMAYECLKGEPPFSRGQIEFQILNEPPPPLAEDGGAPLTGEAAILAAGVMAGLAKKPEDRPPTCAAVLEGNSRVEHAERVESVGSRVPRDRERVEFHTPPPLRGTSPETGEVAAGRRGMTPTPRTPSKLEGVVAGRGRQQMVGRQVSPSSQQDDVNSKNGGAVKAFVVTVILVALAVVGGLWLVNSGVLADSGVKEEAVAKPGRAVAPRPPRTARGAVPTKLPIGFATASEVSPSRSERGVRRKVQLWENGPYWACKNIGAEEPWESGYYFWWGDTIGYKYENGTWVASDGSSFNFSFIEGNTPTYSKYSSSLQSEGWITAYGVLAPEHDAAHVHWGGEWRMPTKEEQDDLCSKCEWTWTTMNGVNGYVVRGRGNYASENIFLPCSGVGVGTSLRYSGSYGLYWSSVPGSDDINSRNLVFDSSNHDTDNDNRVNGFSVRPVQGFTK